MRDKWGRLIFGILLFGVGIAVSVYAGHVLYLSLSSKSWPTTEAKVLKSDIQTIFGQKPRDQNRYYPEVLYEYRVEGQRYTNDTIQWQKLEVSDSRPLKTIIDKYKLGTTVTVHYSPRYPGNSVLDPGFHLNAALPALWASFLLFAGGAFLVSFVVRMRNTSVSELQGARYASLVIGWGIACLGFTLLCNAHWTTRYLIAPMVFLLALIFMWPKTSRRQPTVSNNAPVEKNEPDTTQ